MMYTDVMGDQQPDFLFVTNVSVDTFDSIRHQFQYDEIDHVIAYVMLWSAIVIVLVATVSPQKSLGYIIFLEYLAGLRGENTRSFTFFSFFYFYIDVRSVSKFRRVNSMLTRLKSVLLSH